MNIADAVSVEAVREDKLFNAASLIQRAKCLPQETKDALVKHISDARTKHPRTEPADEAPYANPNPGTPRAKVGKAVDKMLAKGAK